LDVQRRGGVFLNVWLAWACNALVAWAAMTLFAGVLTHLFAAIFGYDARFGEPAAFWYGHPLYDPWTFLEWGLTLAPPHPWGAFLCVLLALVLAPPIFSGLAPGC
jgi:hypothetical protein